MLEFQKITKKQAIDILGNEKNFLIQSIFKDENYVKNLIEKRYQDLESYYKKENVITEREKRHCIKKQSNALQFSNDSWLYFHNFQKAYIYENWLLLTSEKNCMVYRIC